MVVCTNTWRGEAGRLERAGGWIHRLDEGWKRTAEYVEWTLEWLDKLEESVLKRALDKKTIRLLLLPGPGSRLMRVALPASPANSRLIAGCYIWTPTGF